MSHLSIAQAAINCAMNCNSYRTSASGIIQRSSRGQNFHLLRHKFAFEHSQLCLNVRHNLTNYSSMWGGWAARKSPIWCNKQCNLWQKNKWKLFHDNNTKFKENLSTIESIRTETVESFYNCDDSLIIYINQTK